MKSTSDCSWALLMGGISGAVAGRFGGRRSGAVLPLLPLSGPVPSRPDSVPAMRDPSLPMRSYRAQNLIISMY